ncbi:MAG: isoprenylcysteine carboxylmethyltransferase family protein [Desulfobacula sp.]|jgi:protein-S-isoprenylcysteine O-methyltransferase Ste14
MKKEIKDSAGVRIPPPVFFFICLGAGLWLESIFPDIAMQIPSMTRFIPGLVLTLLSGGLAVMAVYTMLRNKTTIDTNASTARIVQNGVFRFSRNPMYLSLLLLLSGIALWRWSMGLMISVPVLYTLILFLAIKPEERYLTRKFGKEYTDYAARVRRWI